MSIAISSLNLKVCLVMVTYNRKDVLLQSIQAIQRQIRPVDYFILVDNASTDGTVETITGLNFPLIVVRMIENLGYAAGLAEGMNYALTSFSDIKYFWLMDDDSHTAPDSLSVMLDAKEKYPFQGILSLTGFVDTLWRGPVRLSNYEHKQMRLINSSLALFEVDHALIDGALVDREVVEKIGVPNGEFFMMCEDVEYCKRMKRAGYQIIVQDKEALIDRLHFGGGGGFTKSNLWRGYYGARNHLLILKDYFSWRALLIYVIRQLKYLIASLKAEDRIIRIRLRLLGIWHGLLGKKGKTLDPIKYL